MVRAGAVAARVVGIAGFGAVVAFFEMATERRLTTGEGPWVNLSRIRLAVSLRQWSANLDGSHDAQLFPRKRMSFPVSGAVLSKNVGHFESGPWHPESISGAFVAA